MEQDGELRLAAVEIASRNAAGTDNIIKEAEKIYNFLNPAETKDS